MIDDHKSPPPRLRLVSNRPRRSDFESYDRHTQSPRNRQRALAPWPLRQGSRNRKRPRRKRPKLVLKERRECASPFDRVSPTARSHYLRDISIQCFRLVGCSCLLARYRSKHFAEQNCLRPKRYRIRPKGPLHSAQRGLALVRSGVVSRIVGLAEQDDCMARDYLQLCREQFLDCESCADFPVNLTC